VIRRNPGVLPGNYSGDFEEEDNHSSPRSVAGSFSGDFEEKDNHSVEVV